MQHPEWKSWKWQQQNAIRDFATLKNHWPWLQDGVEQTQKHFGFQITPYYFNLIDSKNPSDPLAKICIPSIGELKWRTEEMADPIGDVRFTPTKDGQKIKGIVHRYPDRCLLLLTTLCASYCRYCFRREIVSDAEATFDAENIRRAVEYIRETPTIKEVILSGGDPLLLSDRKLLNLLNELSEISHLRLLRIHTKFPVFNPFRITKELCEGFANLKTPLCVVLHVTHPSEITPELKLAFKDLRMSGVMLLNQSVLVKDCNDQVEILSELSYRLAECGVKPHYLHQMDLAKGTSHFRVPLGKAQKLIKEMRGKLPGHLIPQLTLDLPGGLGKIPVEASYLSEDSKANYKIQSPLEEAAIVNYFDSPAGAVD